MGTLGRSRRGNLAASFLGSGLRLLLVGVSGGAAQAQEGLHDLAALLTDRGVVLWRGDHFESVPGTEGTECLCWDRDRSHLLLADAGRIDRWRVAEGESPRRLGSVLARDEVEVQDLSVHPFDGRLLWSEQDPAGLEWWLWTCRTDGAQPKRIELGNDVRWLPDGAGFTKPGETWSGDARFRARAQGHGSIEVENLGASDAEHSWRTSGSADHAPSFSADGTHFAYVQRQDGAPPVLVECTVTGEGAHRAFGAPVRAIHYAPPAPRFRSIAELGEWSLACARSRDFSRALGSSREDPTYTSELEALRSGDPTAPECLFLAEVETLDERTIEILRSLRLRSLYLPDLVLDGTVLRDELRECAWERAVLGPPGR